MRVVTLLLVVAVAACGDDAGSVVRTPDAGAPDAAPAQGLKLETWVHELVTERAADTAEPDTVEDKVIINTEDPAAFDQYFQAQ